MKASRIAIVGYALSTLALGLPSRAQAIGFGIEGGGTFASSSDVPGGGPSTAGSGNLGLIVENKFDIFVVFLDLWADVQTPMRLQTGGSVPAQFVPIDLGLRLGLNLGPIQPYLGLLGQMAIATDSGDGPAVNSPLYGLGGDIGLDIGLFFLRFGVELRAVDTGSVIQETGSGGAAVNAFEFEGLASARLSF